MHKFFKSFSLSIAVVVTSLAPFLIQNSANAEVRNGVDGRITNVRVCNQSNSTRVDMTAYVRTTSNQPVSQVDFKSRFGITDGQWYTSGYNWRHVGTSRNSGWNYVSYTWVGSRLTTDPVLASIHVKGPNGWVIDLGGIVNLGIIPLGECRSYNN